VQLLQRKSFNTSHWRKLLQIIRTLPLAQASICATYQMHYKIRHWRWTLSFCLLLLNISPLFKDYIHFTFNLCKPISGHDSVIVANGSCVTNQGGGLNQQWKNDLKNYGDFLNKKIKL
jgi:hypothetical protein